MILFLFVFRRYQCVIDLKANVLRIGSESLSFLSEKDSESDIFFSSATEDTLSRSLSSPSTTTTKAKMGVNNSRSSTITTTSNSNTSSCDRGPSSFQDRVVSAGRREIDEEKIKRCVLRV